MLPFSRNYEKEEEYDEIAEDGQYYREKTEVAQALSVSSSTHGYSKWPQDQDDPLLGLHMLIIIRSIPSLD
jgi:hypothetical protein